MQPDKYDVVILGGGNAGIGVTAPTRAAGLSVRHGRVGRPRRHMSEPGMHAEEGAGRRRTCAARNRTGIRSLHLRGRTAARLGRPDRPRKADDQPIPGSLGRLMADRGVEVIRGEAAFAGPNAVRVGDRMIEARHIVIATGSKPRSLPIPGADLMITSDDVLSERQQPSEVVFIGGGVIALEFAHVYARAGTKVTILEVLPQLLPAHGRRRGRPNPQRERADRHRGQHRSDGQGNQFA